MVTIFSNSSAELISGLDLDQSGAFILVFGLNQKAQPRTKPKSEVTHCVSMIGCKAEILQCYNCTNWLTVLMKFLLNMVHSSPEEMNLRPINREISRVGRTSIWCLLMSSILQTSVS